MYLTQCGGRNVQDELALKCSGKFCENLAKYHLQKVGYSDNKAIFNWHPNYVKNYRLSKTSRERKNKTANDFLYLH
jgi:hypothetical protein